MPFQTIPISYHRHSDHAYVASLLVLLTVCGDAAFTAIALIHGFWFHLSPGLSLATITPQTILSVSNRDAFGPLVFGQASMMILLALVDSYSVASIVRPRMAARAVIKAVLSWSLIFLSLTLISNLGSALSPLLIAYSAFAILILLFAWRYLLSRFLRKSRIMNVLRQRVLVIGWNEQVAQFHQNLKNAHGSEFHIVGCVPPSNGAYGSPPPRWLPRFASINQLEAAIRSHEVHLVVLSERNISEAALATIIATCERNMIRFKAIPSEFRVLHRGLGTSLLAGTPLLGVDGLPLDRPFNRILKRSFDLIFGSFALAISIPIIAIFGVLVYLESPGAILYRQTRTGRNGREFQIIKIRSMRLDAEADGSVGWTSDQDPRRLRIGAFMREFNVDELPQFWNVLHGEMSIVGPRPERPELIERFKNDIPHYNLRHLIKPGITGWAQVNGLRGDTDLAKRVLFDLHYLENWSLAFDFSTILRTIQARQNAY